MPPKAFLRDTSTVGMVLLAILVALVGGAGVWMARESRGRVQVQILKEHSLIARLQAQLVGAEIGSRLRLVESYATRPSIVEAATGGDWAEIAGQLERFVAEHDEFVSAAVTDREGDIRGLQASDASTARTEAPYRDNFDRAVSEVEPFVSDAFFLPGTGRRLGIAFSARVETASGVLLGVLQATSDLSQGALIPSIRGEQAGEIELFDKRGTPILGNEHGGLSSGFDHFGVAEALNGKRGAGRYRDPGSGQHVVGGYAPVPGLRWALVSEEPGGRASTSIRPLLYQLGSVGIAVLLVAAVVAWLLMRLLRKLAAERNRSETLLGSMADGVLATDVEGRIVLMNPAMEAMIGWSLAEARGRVAQDITGFSVGSPERTAEALEKIFSALRAGEVVTPPGSDHTMRSRDGRTIPIQWTAAPLSDGEEVTGIVMVVRDVTRERETDRLKASLVSTVSHELRTPLTMIQGFAELLTSRDMPEPSRREAIAQIYSSSERLSDLIDDLLSVTRIESGRVVVEPEEVDLPSAIGKALDRFSPDDRARVSIRISAGLPALLADRNAVIKILTNLVSNAFIYSPASSAVEISARQNDGMMEIGVTDQGIGLAPEDAAKVFEKFFRADDSDVRETPGTGLGLYITRNLVEANGGRIWVESDVGAGSRFHVSLPCAVKASATHSGDKLEVG